MQSKATLLDGKSLATKIRCELKKKLAAFIEEGGFQPVLATILVGDNPASAAYVRMKLKACKEIGLDSRPIMLGENTSTSQLLEEIEKLNADPKVSGILLQHPVPSQIDERVAFDAILPEKDVDGVNSLGFGRISLGLPAFTACTPAGILSLMDAYKIPIKGRHAVVVGRSPILGRPMAMLLLQRNATVTICHSHTGKLDRHLREADIVIAACGKPRFIKGEWLKQGLCLIDAGYNAGNAGNVGDVDYDSCLPKASYITPVPGGVGPMTIARLLEHTLQAAFQSFSHKNNI